MTQENSAPAMPACIPYFQCQDVDAAIAWYKALGYTENYTMNGPDGKAMHTMLTTPCGRVPVMFSFNPAAKPIQGTILYCTVPEGVTVDQAYEQIKAGGATITEELTNQFWGDRTFTFVDPYGLAWTLAQKVAEMVVPEGVTNRELTAAL